MQFALILTLFGYESPDMLYAIDTGLTAEDCDSQMAYHQQLLEKTFVAGDFLLTCEGTDSFDE